MLLDLPCKQSPECRSAVVVSRRLAVVTVELDVPNLGLTMPDVQLGNVWQRQFDGMVAATSLRCAVFERWSAECCVNVAFSAVTLSVGIVEELGDDGTVFVGDVNARIPNPGKKHIVLGHLFVEDAELSNDGLVDLRSTRVGQSKVGQPFTDTRAG